MLGPIFGDINPGYLAPNSGKYSPGGIGLGEFLSNLLTAITLVAGLGAFAYLIFGGFRYLTAGGDEKAMSEASKIITNAVIGLLIIIAAWLIARILETVFGINIIAPTFVGPTI